MLVQEIKNKIEENKILDRSQWQKGVSELALDIMEVFANTRDITMEDIKDGILYNGALSWSHASWSGSFLIYDEDIAKLLCTPSELKRTKNGQRKPNKNEEWLDTQARALSHAETKIKRIIKGLGV